MALAIMFWFNVGYWLRPSALFNER